ncbi:MAG TPA: iron-sulfur cluster repair di-iron protein [Ilumatobacteraceae bacterium]|nr:iron-sulfur cluster repair di-iron protein [Ilumatobacteraceae bacterium]
MTDVQQPTLGQIVVANPAAARVLESYGLDYCCGGHRSLSDACAAAGVDPRAVTDALDHVRDEGEASWTALDAPSLARQIVATHHQYLHEELPRLDALAEKVLAVHGERHPELVEVRRLVSALRADLEPHLLKEERILFPAIDALAAGRREFHFGSVENPIRMMEREHELAGDLLAALRAVTAGYDVPADGCASFRSLYARLAELEADTHEHIHKENNVLFPAAIQMFLRGDQTG